MEGVLYTLKFSPRGGCIYMHKMRFLVSISMLWMSWMNSSTVTAHGVDLGLLSIAAVNPPLDSQIDRQSIWFSANQYTHIKKQIHSPHPSPQGSPNGSPTPAPAYHSSPSPHPPPPPPPPPPKSHRTLPPHQQQGITGTPNSASADNKFNTGTRNSASADNKFNTGKMTGLVLLSIAGLLQVVVVTYLLVKRKQMLQVVEKYEV